jgi:hypothetical protein
MKTPQVIGGIQVRPGLIPPATLTKDMAEKLAEMNQVSEVDGWTYHAVLIPQSKRNLYHVEVRDETGEVVGYL